MIETGRLVLRPMVEDDRPWFLGQTRDAEVMALLGGVQPPELANAKFDYMRGLFAQHGFTFWLMVTKSGGDRIGICGLKTFDSPGAPQLAGALEIGWRLNVPWWGKGYAREAAVASLDHAFGAIGGTLVYSITSDRNVASWGLMERLGMTRRRDLDFVDPRFAPEDNPTIVYSIEADIWRT